MNIQFKQGQEHLTEKAITQTQAKISKLSRFITERNYEAQVSIFLDRESGSHTSDKMWRASLNLDLAGDRFNAENINSKPEKAIDAAIVELKRELHRANGKQQSIMKRGGAVLKRLRRGFA